MSGRFVVLVCGGRDFSNAPLLGAILGDVYREKRITRIVHGMAKGADLLADRWAKANNIVTNGYPAHWGTYGKAAGPKRNVLMLDSEKPDLVVAFAGGKGTAHMVSIARKAGVEVREIFPDQPSEMPAVENPEPDAQSARFGSAL